MFFSLYPPLSFIFLSPTLHLLFQFSLLHSLEQRIETTQKSPSPSSLAKSSDYPRLVWSLTSLSLSLSQLLLLDLPIQLDLIFNLYLSSFCSFLKQFFCIHSFHYMGLLIMGFGFIGLLIMGGFKGLVDFGFETLIYGEKIVMRLQISSVSR